MHLERHVVEEYRHLHSLVSRYEDAYRKGESPLSDEEFDALAQKLDDLDDKHPGLRRLVEGHEQVPAWSLVRTFEEADVQGFDERVRAALGKDRSGHIDYAVEPKIDGSSLVVVYRAGHLQSAQTRGLEGKPQDVTAKVLKTRAVPSKLVAMHGSSPGLLAVRGEATVSLSTYRALNCELRQRGWDIYPTPRDLVHGVLLRRNGPLISAEDPPMEVHIFQILKTDTAIPECYDEVMAWLASLGLTPVPDRKLCRGLDEVLTRYQELLSVRDTYDYEMDGIAIKVNRLSWQRELGETRKRAAGREKRLARWALAYKFPYRGELATVLRLVRTDPRDRELPFEAELRVEGRRKPLRGSLDPSAGPSWTHVVAGDVVRFRKALGKPAEVIEVDTVSETRQDLTGITFALLGELSTLDRRLADEITQARQARIADSVDDHPDFAVAGGSLTPEVVDQIREVGAQILTEREFLAMLGLEPPIDAVLGHQLTLL